MMKNTWSRLTIAMLFCLGTFPLVAGAVNSSKRPNVLFIAVDDLRPELGCYGIDAIHSPNIDRLAARGVLFERAYCQMAVCNPSRVSLMTGLRPDSAKVWDLATRFRHTIADIVTLPQQFKKEGYHTVSFGKIFHNPWPDNRSWSQPHRWPEDSKLWSTTAKQQLAEYRDKLRADGKSEAAIKRMRAVASEIVDVADDEHIDGAIAQQALRSMRRLSAINQPFFLAVGFLRPHLPFVVPRTYWELYDRAKLTLAENRFLPSAAPSFAMNTMYELRDYMDFADSSDPRIGSLTESQQRRLKHGYYASVSMIDAQVGQLLDELKTLGLEDNTVVVLWGDHGWKLGEHNSWCKQSNYEIDTRVPLIIRHPDAKGNGRVCDALVELVDLYPTLCDLAGLSIPDHAEGQSLVALLNDPGQSIKQAAFSQFRRRDGKTDLMGYAMRTDRYRYVEWINCRSRKAVARELYDHVFDPQENTNLAVRPEQADRIQRLNQQLWSSLPTPPAWTAGDPKPIRPAIHFQNDSSDEIAVYWLPDQGSRHLVGEIKPGGTLRQNSTHGHRFLIVDQQDRQRRIVTVTKSSETVVITAQDQNDKGNERPNLVVIMGDDWSWPHAGILGDSTVKTPTFDQIAKEGVLFEHAFVSSPSCTPSRFACATGQHHWRLGQGDSLGGSLAADVPVYPDLLADAGYATGYCRKGAAPSKHAYRGNDPFGPRFKDFGEFLSQQTSEQPFCFWYGAGEPHRPYDWQASLKSDLELETINVPACLPDNQTIRTDLGDYYLRIQKLDHLAGEIMRELEDAGQLDNTIVIMTGDNGMPFPRCKASLYDMGTRVPLAIRWGKKVQGGQRVSDFVSLTDLAPTILDAAGLPIPGTMTGGSLLPILNHEPLRPDRDHVLIGRERHVYLWPARGIRTRDFLYIRNVAPKTWTTGKAPSVPQYDFAQTPWPTRPLAFSFNCDPSPTKQWMLENAMAIARLHQLAFDLPPKEELYDLRIDPDQLNNVAEDSNYEMHRKRLSDQLELECRGSGDPRARQLKPQTLEKIGQQ